MVLNLFYNKKFRLFDLLKFEVRIEISFISIDLFWAEKNKCFK